MLQLLHDNLLLGTLLLHHTSLLLPYFEDALREAQTRIREQQQDMFLEVKPSVHVRLCRLPHCRELQKPTVSSIRAVDINHLLQVLRVARACECRLVHA